MGQYIGIDLGTTFSSLAYLNALGEPVIAADEKTGAHSLPSAVSWTQDGQCLVGLPAIHSRYTDVSRAVRWIKRQMGERAFQKRIDGVTYKPEDISAKILRSLKESAEKQIGNIAQVIITVPANFEDIARSATKEAGRKAGLDVIGLVDEPVAAAYYFAVKTSIRGKVLVFDLGGGTLDISVVEIKDENGSHSVRTITSLGDRFLGGYNFDQKLTAYFAQRFKEQMGKELFTNDEERAMVEDYAETVKCGLEGREKISFHLDGAQGGRYHGELEAETFKQIIEDELATVKMLLEAVVTHEAKMDFNDIDHIVLVGGSSRLECIREIIAKMFGKAPVILGNVDEVVALGAALYAKKLLEKPTGGIARVSKEIEAVPIRAVCNHGYGFICMDENREEHNHILIPKNTEIPTVCEQDTASAIDNQQSIQYQVTQGESDDIDMVSVIKEVTIPLPPNTPAGTRVKVKFKYDINQLMHCSFIISGQSTGKEIELDLNKLT